MCKEERSYHLTPPYLTPLLEEAGQGICLSGAGGMLLAAAEQMQIVQDESVRLQNVVT